MPAKALKQSTQQLQSNNVKKIILILLVLTVSTNIVTAQTKTRSVQKNVQSPFQKLIAGTGLPFRLINDSLAAIPYEGENIPSYQVVVQRLGDLLIIFTDLTEATSNKIDESKYKYLLQQNDHFDIVKIGMSSDSNFYIRADVYRNGVTTALLTRIIKQVANVTNIIAGEMKQ